MVAFKARARAVEMLGRQQIASIPTAISELFKNAHDAYADSAEVDYLRYAATFVLRDDGIGMSRTDFEDRWLVLGTDSKIATAGSPGAPRDPGKPARAVLGEKGIGRLAIAAIGPQVLILTRPKFPPFADLTAAFINWDLFAIPGLNLDELTIPVRTFRWGVVPGPDDVASLLNETRRVIRELGARFPESQRSKIDRDLSAFKVDPGLLMEYLGNPSLVEGHGTHFYISPVDEALPSALVARSDDIASPLVKMLIGFSNTMTPSHPPQVMRTAFRDHEDNLGNFNDPIAESEFFTPDEFSHADHHLEGSFDDYGQFKGSITVYGQRTEDYQLPYAAQGATTQCGPFRINIAVVQGAERESMLPAERWVNLYSKLSKIGGLYIYRDDIRVLPYGNNDYDFIDIEKRRTLSAKYYYFSYRRIFGVIEIDSSKNSRLVEKAGREGFRENTAYQQFKAILENFFVNVAANFFREGGDRADIFIEKRAELDRIERARRKREKLASERRSAFATELERNFERINSGQPQLEAAGIVADLTGALEVFKASVDQEYAQRGFIRAQADALHSLSELRNRYRAARPRGVGLTQRLRRDFEAYNAAFSTMVDSVVQPTEQEVEALIQDAARGSLVTIDRRLRFHRAIEQAVEEAKSRVAMASTRVAEVASTLRNSVNTIGRDARIAVDDLSNGCLSDAATVNITGLADSEIVERRLSIESKLLEEAERQFSLLTEIADQIASLTWERDDTGELISGLDMSESLADEILELRERLDADLELSQLGMAVKVINHEFESTIRSVRASLRKLRAWSDANPPIRQIYEAISFSFEHLDGYLRLFTPLQRRLYRTAVEIKGSDIAKFIGDLFEERLRRDDVRLVETRVFKAAKIIGYPSTYYPVFINLVDNALHWVQQSKAERVISFDASADSLIVANSGPEISLSDRERIFEQGFSKRPGGRGLGLYISREVLRGEGGDLMVVQPPAGFGAAFAISIPPDAKSKT
jgi:signal transduction histidine kinase